MPDRGNETVVRRFFEEIINKGNTTVIGELMTPGYREHGAPDAPPGNLEGFRRFLTMVGSAFPDIQVTIEDVIGAGDKVVARLTVRGTHTGTLMGTIPATNRRAVWTGIDIFRVVDGRIAERWSQRDLLGLMQQLGVISQDGG